MRIGLTQFNPCDKFELPQYALPDLHNMGKSWIFAVTKSHNKVYSEHDTEEEGVPYQSVLGNDAEVVHTPRGSFSRSLLLPLGKLNLQNRNGDNISASQKDNVLPTDVGSRIGIMYTVVGNSAEMHFIINGEDQGPCVRNIPYNNGALHAVVDVYGTTKQVRIIQLYGVSSLQNACRNRILQLIAKKDISNLPLPTKLKQFLNYEL